MSKRKAETLQDQQIVCKDCSGAFTFTVREQTAFAAKGFQAKVRCADCTKAKKELHGESTAGEGGKKTLTQTRCFNCGKKGHTSQDCAKPQGSTACFVCGSEDHQSRSCPKAPTAPSPAAARCFSCGGIGHLGKDCPKPNAESVCYTCGKPGHTSRYCRSGPATNEVDTAHIEDLVTRRP